MSQTELTDGFVTISVDVGGTNTDLILTTNGKEYCHKIPSTRQDPSLATVNGVFQIAENVGIRVNEIDRVLHGTTIATNALIERRFEKTGMITTEGFRDIVFIGSHKKPYNFSIKQDVVQQRYPLVRRRHIKTVKERIVFPGIVDVSLDEEQVLRATEELIEEGISSIAICFLFSFLNPQHEERARKIIEKHFPDILVTTSSGVAPQFREWSRFTTAVINCSLMRLFSTYVENLHGSLLNDGIQAELLLVQSSGGMATPEESRPKPVNFLYSGPAGGVLLTKYITDILSIDNMIGLDMGGTSCDIVVIKDGRIPEVDPRDSTVAGYPVLVPMLDIDTNGSGGSSIAWIDQGGGFNVGPKSAGAEPGPACYGRGGTAPTVTDAQLVLGRLSPDTFLGGRLPLDTDLAKAAIEKKLCNKLTGEQFSDVYRAAAAIVELSNHKMAQAVHNQTIRRGHDPRRFSLLCYGGAGPTHACDLAEIIGISKVVIPRWPGIGSARGFLYTDIKYSHAKTVNALLDDADQHVLEQVFEDLETEGKSELKRGRVPDKNMRFIKYVDCMYQGQGYELRIDFKGFRESWRADIDAAFEKKHRIEYGHIKASPIKIVTLRLEAVGLIPKINAQMIEEGTNDPSHALRGTSRVYFGDPMSLKSEDVSRYYYDDLKVNNVIPGPAIIDEMDTTTVIKSGWQAVVTGQGYLVLSRC